MELCAETLRYALVLAQTGLLLWLLTSDLWRRIPLWTLWLGGEILSRMIFFPSGAYWHALWLPLQPTLLFLLLAGTLESLWHSGFKFPVLELSAVVVLPVSLSLDLGEIIILRGILSLICGLVLLHQGLQGSRSSTAQGHAVLFGILCLATSGASWRPSSGTLWWELRTAYLGIYLVCIGAWWRLFTRTD